MTWCGVNILSKFQLSSSYGLEVMMFWISGGKGWLAHWINYEAVCRAVPGLLIIPRAWHIVGVAGIFLFSTTSNIESSVYREVFQAAWTPLPQINWSERLCNMVVDVPPGAEVPKCNFPNCKMTHDLAAFLKTKPPDVGKDCYVFSTFGYCPRYTWGVLQFQGKCLN